MEKTYKTTAAFVRKIVESDMICTEWKEKIKREFPEVFKKTEKICRELVKFDEKLTITTKCENNPVVIGQGLAPEGLKGACLVTCPDIEVEVEGGVITFFKNVTVEVYALQDSESVTVSKKFLLSGFNKATNTVQKTLIKEFGSDAFSEDTVYFGESVTVTPSTKADDNTPNPLFIVKNWAQEDSDRLRLIAFNEEYFDVIETRDFHGNRAFGFKPKK